MSLLKKVHNIGHFGTMYILPILSCTCFLLVKERSAQMDDSYAGWAGWYKFIERSYRIIEIETKIFLYFKNVVSFRT